MTSNKFFIEVDCSQRCEYGQSVSGDVYLQKKHNGRVVLVMCDGAGSGIKANVIASVIASMTISYTYTNESVLRAAQSVVETFARGEKSNDVTQSTFTIIDIDEYGHVKVVEFENPPIIVTRMGNIYSPERKEYKINVSSGHEITIHITEFQAEDQDRIIAFSDGITMSGYATRRTPGGWGQSGVQQMILKTINNKPEISAYELCRQVVDTAEMNDLFMSKNDMSCMAVYCRQPRKIMVCTGPPYNKENDKLLAEMVADYNGDVVISGGTTAQIISRELGRDISVVFKRDKSGLPPASNMEGVKMITEGVLTLGKVRAALEDMKSTDIKDTGIDSKLIKLFLEHDIVEFVVGTKINAVHQDPNLPIELELRRNVVKDIARLLETKFMKEISVRYL